MPRSNLPRPISYQDAGVNIDEADRAVGAIRKMARATFTKGVLTDIGSFGGCFALPKMRQPVLVSSVDGVGTKLKVAFMAGRHNTIGEDLVNHCVNDIAVQGAKPLFFLDYLATGRLEASVAAQVISGIARGCTANGCALIGGETAEMPGMYLDGEYDIAGTIVGAVEKRAILTGAKAAAGDVLLALPSNGLHTNGYSLARKLLFEVAGFGIDSLLPETGTVLADELLRVHRSYLKAIVTLVRAGSILAAAHITGGGVTDNLPRVIPKGLAASIDTRSWQVPPLFTLLRAIGSVPEDDWRRTFNLGIGMILVVPKAKADAARRALRRIGEEPWVIGELIAQRRGRRRVEYRS
jgi:phosphoribosylformylglycinamidine cyclo-ligase